MSQHRVFVNCRLIPPATAKYSLASELWHWSCGEKLNSLALLLLNIMLILDAIKYLIYVLFILAFLIFIFMSASPVFGAPANKE